LYGIGIAGYKLLQLCGCFLGFLFFALYVGKMVLTVPQDCLREKLDFATAMFFSVCFDVGYAFFSTRPAWLYVENGAVWLWQHATSAFFSAQEFCLSWKSTLLLCRTYPSPYKKAEFSTR
jgi:hypothetical protein